MTAAVADNPDLARWQNRGRTKRRAALRLEKARGVPDLTIGGGVRRFEQTDDEALVFSLTLPLPLFDRNQGGILGATAQLAKARPHNLRPRGSRPWPPCRKRPTRWPQPMRKS